MRALLGMTFVLGFLVMTNYVWSIIVDYGRELDQRLEIRALEYRNLQRLIAGSDEYAEQTALLQAFQERLAREHLVRAASPPLSEAMFQNIVNELSSGSGINIVSMRMLPRTERDGVLLLRLMINARAEISAIKDFMLAVETNPRFIFFNEVEIRQSGPTERRFYTFNAQLAAVTAL
ncbi:GspMb/PilO family protein [Desulfonatronum parangueonense]